MPQGEIQPNLLHVHLIAQQEEEVQPGVVLLPPHKLATLRGVLGFHFAALASAQEEPVRVEQEAHVPSPVTLLTQMH